MGDYSLLTSSFMAIQLECHLVYHKRGVRRSIQHLVNCNLKLSLQFKLKSDTSYVLCPLTSLLILTIVIV